MSLIFAARTLSIVGHPALLLPLAVVSGASGADVPPQRLQAALTATVLVAVIVGLYSLWQVRSGNWAHVDASHPRERSQLNLFLAAALFSAAAALWMLGEPNSVASGPVAIALLVLLTQLLRHWLKVSLHAAFAVFAAALLWPDLVGTVATALLAAGVAWSRLELRRHTTPEVALGLLLGAVFGVGLRLVVG